jgi:hypothetical protein
MAKTYARGTEWGKRATQPNNDVKCRNESNDVLGSRTPTFALAFSYASVHARENSGTNAGLSTGGGYLGIHSGYTSGIGGPEGGEGKGMKISGGGRDSGWPWLV